MEHRRSLISTAEALYRVLQTGTLPRPVFHTRLPPPPQRQQKRHAVFVSKRYAAGQGLAPTPSDGPLLDENINAHEVIVIGADNKLQAAVPRASVLRTLDRKKYFLKQVSQASDSGIPLCKIVERKAVFFAQQAKLKKARNVQTATKQLELSWAIAPADLEHRVNKMEEFLAQGRRVEVILGVKKKGRGGVATRGEAEALVQRIRARIQGVQGAKEWKEAEGAVGERMMLFFVGAAKK